MSNVEKGQTWVHHKYTYPQGAVEVLNVTDTHVEFSPAGGGFVYKGPIETFVGLHVLRPADAADPPWIAARFELESDEGPWPGYWQGFRWNGWATPEFERDAVLAILRAVEAEWTEEGDVFVLTDNVNGEADPVRLEPRAVIVDGRATQLYAFDGWCFSVAREEVVP
jgi:hypothetical protein